MCEAFSTGTTPLAVNPTRVIEVKILTALNNGGGSGGGGGSSGGGVSAGNYAGGQPNFTPATAGAIAIDTSTGREWTWYNNQWQ